MAQVDLVFRAIAHPTRRSILALLAAGPRSVSEILAEFHTSQPAISQHLLELKAADLVASRRIGSRQQYRLTPQPLKTVLEWSEPFRTLIDPSGHAWTFVQSSPCGLTPHERTDRRGD